MLNKVINVDQAPLGSTPSSTPATYCGVFDLIRELFAKVPEAKVRGYSARRFSFNQPGGRCETCEGAGQKRIEMHFLPDVWITCDACVGTRYTTETLTVKFRGRTIADVLNMSVNSALELFEHVPRVRRILQTLVDVGLGYIPLGQAAPHFRVAKLNASNLQPSWRGPTPGTPCTSSTNQPLAFTWTTSENSSM